MAEIVPTITEIGRGAGNCIRAVWTPVTENDTCRALYYPNFNDKSVQVLGTFGGATIAVHGSNDGGTTYAALNDPTGTAIGITSAKIKAVLENTEFVKPVISGGSSQSVTIAMMIHQIQPLRQ